MPSSKPSRKQPAQRRRLPIFPLVAVVVAVIALVVYFGLMRKPVPVAPEATPAATAPAPTFATHHIYSATADPVKDIAAGVAEAKREHKRVILDFGGDWCGDCQVLDFYFHQPPNEELLEKNFVLVDVWIGQMDRNIDVAAKYGVPISRGVPALAVLAPDGKLLYSQAAGQFDDMRHMDPGSVTEFLKKWKS